MAKHTEEKSEFQMLKAAIREKNPQRLYFFHGEETFLLQHYLEQLKKILIDELTESFNYHKLTNETFDIQAFADAVENLPMMAEHTMVVVDEVDLFKLADAERTKMAELLSDIPDYCTVVFTYEVTIWKPDKRYTKLYEAVNKGTAVEFEKQDQRNLIPWISRHFAARGKAISADLCVYLIELTGGTMTSLSSEIAKIAAYSGADHIVKSDIDAVTEPVLDAIVYQMTNFLSQGKYADALAKLQQLFKMQEPPLVILGGIGGHFRRLSAAKILFDNGHNSSEIRKLYPNLQDYAARKAMEAARQFSNAFYQRASELVLETDRSMKTSYGDEERLLEMLILKLAQEAAND